MSRLPVVSGEDALRGGVKALLYSGSSAGVENLETEAPLFVTNWRRAVGKE